MSVFDRTRIALAGTIDEIIEARRKATEELIKLRAGLKLMTARADELRGELARIEADRAEQEAFVAELLRARRELDVKLRGLQAREGTVAAELAALEEGGNPFATEGGAWDRMDDAERKVEDAAAEAEGEMEGVDAADAASDQVRRVGREARAEEELEALKRKLRGDGE
jgi:chromosome segregation ATPase